LNILKRLFNVAISKVSEVSVNASLIKRVVFSHWHAGHEMHSIDRLQLRPRKAELSAMGSVSVWYEVIDVLAAHDIKLNRIGRAIVDAIPDGKKELGRHSPSISPYAFFLRDTTSCICCPEGRQCGSHRMNSGPPGPRLGKHDNGLRAPILMHSSFASAADTAMMEIAIEQ
jgi:hypothetical protein